MQTHYNVVILGTGISGTMMAAILARHGLSVLMIDKESHPRFAVGESTVGHTSAMTQLIADRYDVPEIAYLSSFKKIRKHISKNCGVKRAFGFVYHHADGTQLAEEANQFVIPAHLHGLESHLYRQDIDAYYFNVAVSYGAKFLLHATIGNVQLDEDQVSFATNNNQKFTTDYMIDASGFRSVIAEQLGLRAEPELLESRTRSIFTHMINVKPYDDVIPVNYHQMPVPWFQSTLHHVFEGGWIWVIPFNNTKNNINPLCSVGVTIDMDMYPKKDISPEDEFFEFINRYPSVKKQFEGASAVRSWISTGRLQYTSTNTIGDRFCLLAHAGGFIDPLFSRGLAITMDSIFYLGSRVLDAFAKNEFKAANFKFVDDITLGGVHYHDQLVATSYSSWKDYRLWNAWIRIWALGEAALDQLRIIKAHLDYLRSNDVMSLSDLENVQHPGLMCPDSEAYEKLFRESKSLIDQAVADQISVEDACNQIYELIHKAELVSPAIGVALSTVKTFGHGQWRNLRSFLWGKRKGGAHIKKYYEIRLSEMFKIYLKNFPEFLDPDLKYR
jgi:FADH2 O2-dependent halogenase